ncbi:MAG: hypothetical protein ACKOA8_14830, partial [Deltaproteobacteria bacterium]
MMRFIGLFIVLLGMIYGNGFGVSQGKLLNGSAAIINKKGVTIQDAYIYRALLRIKNGLQPVIFEEEGEELKKTVQKLVFEEMVLAEMKSIQKEVNVQSEVEGWFKDRKDKGRGLEQIKSKYGSTDAELRQRVSRILATDKFVQLKIDTVTPVVTEDEIQKYYRRNEAQFRGRSYENIKPNIIVLLKKQAVQKNLEEWIKSLKDKY